MSRTCFTGVFKPKEKKIKLVFCFCELGAKIEKFCDFGPVNISQPILLTDI